MSTSSEIIPEMPEVSETSKQILETSENDQSEVSVIFCTYGHDGFDIQKVVNNLKK